MKEQYQARINQIEQEQRQEQARKRKVEELTGERIYKNFTFWCMGFAKGFESFKSVVAFKEFMKAEQIELTDYQREYLLTTYFGFKWNEKENKWEKVKWE